MITRRHLSTGAPPDTKTPTKLADLFNAENGTNGRAYLAMCPLLTSTPHKRRTRTIAIGTLRRPSARYVSWLADSLKENGGPPGMGKKRRPPAIQIMARDFGGD